VRWLASTSVMKLAEGLVNHLGSRLADMLVRWLASTSVMKLAGGLANHLDSRSANLLVRSSARQVLSTVQRDYP
jgi:hypothetical protein